MPLILRIEGISYEQYRAVKLEVRAQRKASGLGGRR
jgi:hypothetical protein